MRDNVQWYASESTLNRFVHCSKKYVFERIKTNNKINKRLKESDRFIYENA